MKNANTQNEKINTLARVVLGATGASMLMAFYITATSGGALGSAAYLGVLSIIPITMSIAGWRLMGHEPQEEGQTALASAI